MACGRFLMQVFALCGRSSAWYAQGCSFGHVRGRISGRGGPRTGIYCHSSYLYFVFTNLHIERMRYVCTCTDAPQRSAKPLLRSNKLTLSLNPQHPQFGEGALSCATHPCHTPTKNARPASEGTSVHPRRRRPSQADRLQLRSLFSSRRFSARLGGQPFQVRHFAM